MFTLARAGSACPRIDGWRYFRCKVDPTTLIPLGQDSAKVPSAYVVEEVDELGNPL